MPFLQAMSKRVNAALTKGGLAGLPGDTFAEPGSLVRALVDQGLVEPGAEEDYLEAFPSGLKEAVRAVLHDNLNATGGPLDVTVAWAPGYDDEISLFQVADSDRTDGGITILVRSRYPGDRSFPGGPINHS